MGMDWHVNLKNYGELMRAGDDNISLYGLNLKLKN